MTSWQGFELCETRLKVRLFVATEAECLQCVEFTATDSRNYYIVGVRAYINLVYTPSHAIKIQEKLLHRLELIKGVLFE